MIGTEKNSAYNSLTKQNFATKLIKKQYTGIKNDNLNICNSLK